MNIIFMGTPDFAVPYLERLITDKHIITAVFTQPDKPKGRGNRIVSPPVKLKAIDNKLCVVQPATLRNAETYQFIKNLLPDIIVVVAYGKILPKDILSIPKFGCINIHASVLPKYRGAAPIQWSVINGETETGITSMRMDEGLDTGDILLVEKTNIGENETSGDLFERLSIIGGEVLSNTVVRLMNRDIHPVKQDNNAASYAPMLSKDICPINWNKTAKEVHDLIRGLTPFLCATASLNGRIIKIHSSLICKKTPGEPGEVVDNKEKLTVVCGDGCSIEILKLQTEGKRAMTSEEFLRGNRIDIGTLLK